MFYQKFPEGDHEARIRKLEEALQKRVETLEKTVDCKPIVNKDSDDCKPTKEALIEKLFKTAYDWGKFRVEADEGHFEFQRLVKELLK